MCAIVQIAVAVVLVLSTAGAAFADFRICNRSLVNVDVSFGYQDAKLGWTSQGWWNLAIGNCATVFSGSLPSRYYYLYATGEGGRFWSAPKDQNGGTFCISPLKYLDHSRDHQAGKDLIDCKKDGLQARKFRQVDTGGSTNFTYNLTSRPDDPLRVSPNLPPVSSTAPVAPQTAPRQAAPVAAAPPGQQGAAGTACQRYPNLC